MTTAVEVFGGTLMSPVPDPYPVYRTLRREQPVLPLESPMGDVHLVTRFDDVLAVLEARIALGALLDRLPNLRLADDARILGLAFRSPDRLPVVFDA